MSDLDGRITRAEAARDDARESVRKAEARVEAAEARLNTAQETSDLTAIENAKELFASADANLRANQEILKQAQASLDMLFQQRGVKSAGKLRMNSFSVFIWISITYVMIFLSFFFGQMLELVSSWEFIVKCITLTME
jgi:multidrug efflux pump subunit AcrA (membrane-fusion protein)